MLREQEPFMTASCQDSSCIRIFSRGISLTCHQTRNVWLSFPFRLTADEPRVEPICRQSTPTCHDFSPTRALDISHWPPKSTRHISTRGRGGVKLVITRSVLLVSLRHITDEALRATPICRRFAALVSVLIFVLPNFISIVFSLHRSHDRI